MRSREKATSQRMSRSFQDEEGGKTFQKDGDTKKKKKKKNRVFWELT